MGWSFRKSVSLGGGLRMNLSGRGLGYSIGVRGARMSSGPTGTFVTLGAGGVRYRQRISSPNTTTTHSPPVRQPVANSVYGTQTIDSASVNQLVDEKFSETLGRINDTIHQPAYAFIIAIAGVAVAMLIANALPILSFIIIIATITSTVIAHKADVQRRTFPLFYELDTAASLRWEQLCDAMSKLSHAKRIWKVQARSATYDWKRNAGATLLLHRKRIQVNRSLPHLIATNVVPFCFHLGDQQLYFLPDRLYVLQSGKFGVVDYSDVKIEVGSTSFIESEGAPSDGQIVGYSWRFVNRNGGPDRRFKNNFQLPIMNYGVCDLESTSGLHIILHVSLQSSVNAIGQMFRQTARSKQQNAANNRPEEAFRSSPPPRTPPPSEHRSPPQPPKPKVPDWYAILGVTATSTREEVTAAYRQIVKSYHPDLVTHLAPEFRILAEARMKEFNEAYSRIKMSNGW